MNLGDVYLKAFVAIVGTSFVLAVGSASLLRFRRCSWRTVILVSLPIWLLLGFLTLDRCHQRLFVVWHKAQNTAVPKDGCRAYEPDFTRLYATYSISREDFQAWVRNHAWQLRAGDNGMLQRDAQYFGFDDPELSFESEPDPNGRQLRVYYKSRTLYVAYNAM